VKSCPDASCSQERFFAICHERPMDRSLSALAQLTFPAILTDKSQSTPRSQNRDLGHPPPAHRDKTAMNGAQLFMTHGDSDDRATCGRGALILMQERSRYQKASKHGEQIQS
jgi:hypothetical protein